MNNSSFKPLLACNEEINLDEIRYSLLASTKLDGCRCIFKDGNMLTRSLKQVPNKQLQEKFQPLKDYSKNNNVILDGEIYSHELTFQEIISFFMTEDFTDKKTVKKFGKIMEIPEHLNFYCFDGIKHEQFNEPFGMRVINNVNKWCQLFPNLMTEVKQTVVYNKNDTITYFEEVLEQGYEGLILRDPEGRYKFGRCTLKEGLIYKLKKFLDFDGQIIDIIQATEVDENVEKTINELGYSKTSRKKDDRNLINKASAVLVKFNNKDLKVTLAMTDEEKNEIWNNKEKYINKWITYKAMIIGSKDVPRHPVFLRFRDDK